MRLKALLFLIFAVSVAMLGGCQHRATEAEVRMVLSEVAELQDREEKITAEMLQQPNIFDPTIIGKFPANRSELEPLVNAQIDSWEKLVRLGEIEIEKIRSIARMPVDEKFRVYSDLTAKGFEKSQEVRRLQIEKYRSILDPTIDTPDMLNRKLSVIDSQLALIDEERRALENKKRAIRSPSSTQ
jgi:hypothetical protein